MYKTNTTNSTKSTNSRSYKKRLLLIALVILICTGALGFVYSGRDKKSQENNTEASGNFINLNPPTEEEQKSGDEKANSPVIVDQKPDQDTSNNKRTDVAIVIADASQYGDVVEVRSFVPGHLQNGTCTFKFTLGSSTVTKQTDATPDASSTICGNLVVPRGEFTQPGSWTLEVNYTTNDVDSSSASRQVSIL